MTVDLFSPAGKPVPPEERLPLGWKRSKAGSPYLTKAGLTATVYRKQDGYVWRWKSWSGPAFVEARQPLLTELAAVLAAERALPEARRKIAAMQAPRSRWREEREP
jgi:hypothetical protein